MANRIGILEWANEQSLSSYPLSRSMSPSDFIIDASFVQFDGFTPTLKTVVVSRANVVLTIGTDDGEIKVTTAKPSSSVFPGMVVELDNGNRVIGTLTFGQGLVNIFTQHLDATLKLNIPFLPSVVRGINSNSGVYSIAGYSGDVEVFTGTTTAERTLFFETTDQEVTWNAGWLGTHIDKVPLKSLNSVLPLNNNVFIEESDLIKISPNGNDLQIDVTLPLTRDVLSPAKKYE